MRSSCFFAIAAVFSVATLHADHAGRAKHRLPVPLSGPTCDGGTWLDDGSVETGYRIPFASDARIVQFLRPPQYPATLTRLCGCFLTADWRGNIGFSLVVHDDNGIAGQPGSFLAGYS